MENTRQIVTNLEDFAKGMYNSTIGCLEIIFDAVATPGLSERTVLGTEPVQARYTKIPSSRAGIAGAITGACLGITAIAGMGYIIGQSLGEMGT